jgi:hypothetical protein
VPQLVGGEFLTSATIRTRIEYFDLTVSPIYTLHIIVTMSYQNQTTIDVGSYCAPGTQNSQLNVIHAECHTV